MMASGETDEPIRSTLVTSMSAGQGSIETIQGIFQLGGRSGCQGLAVISGTLRREGERERVSKVPLAHPFPRLILSALLAVSRNHTLRLHLNIFDATRLREILPGIPHVGRCLSDR
jgi:hypothetical protein